MTASLEDMAPQRPRTVWNWVCTNRRCHMPGASVHAAHFAAAGHEYRCFRCQHLMRPSKVTLTMAHKGRKGYTPAQIERLSELTLCDWLSASGPDFGSKAPAKRTERQRADRSGRPAGPKTVGGRIDTRRNKSKAGETTH